jgi:TRAP-type uncharacterized transport system fused permease subunit
MAVTICLSLVFLGTSQWIPGLFNFKGYTFARMVEFVYLAGDEGMYGFLTGISSNILFIYVLFAAVMMKAGVGEFVIDLAVRLAGWARGGPAKIAVIASALFGTISGSTVANVYATGSFTIPLMKKGGYTAKNAAAIEAIAGTGGQIMPDGARAFIMSEVTGISYFEIIGAAIPAPLLRGPDGHGTWPCATACSRCRGRSCPPGGRWCAAGTSSFRSASSSTCWPKATRRPGPPSTRSW